VARVSAAYDVGSTSGMGDMDAAPDPAVLLPPDAPGRTLLARFFRALGDPARLRLLELLLQEEESVSECVAEVGLAQSRVSTHLGCLTDCGFVQARREGRYAYYRVADPRVAELVLLARSLSADNDAALAKCARIDGAAT
jgi:DNA-binding transcriptional ArsR family regulator